MIIINIKRRRDPPAAQTGLILPGGREYNGFLSGNDNNKYKEEEGPPVQPRQASYCQGAGNIMVS